uniref:Uncharacterized protein n=1 Tax=Anguilla anguilla TaxID=7936 RepID=A0A0E9XDG3_ANGAN
MSTQKRQLGDVQTYTKCSNEIKLQQHTLIKNTSLKQ